MHVDNPVPTLAAIVVVPLLVLALLGVDVRHADAVNDEFSDTVRIVKDDEAPSPAELAVRLSESTPMPASGTVVLGRSDVFADSLASGVLQSTSPLMLVPPQGPIPSRVMEEIGDLAPDRVILLGGPTAIGEVVEQELAGSFAVERRAGTTRIETAVEIARLDAPQATTAILSRAFAPAGAPDETQAFADALGAGGLAAEMGWPVLLTQTETLSRSTRDYLAESDITEVAVIGGTAAISDAVVAEMAELGITTQRVAGGTRAETALEIAKLRGAESAADVARVTVVEAQDEDAWAGGFAAAAHSAFYDAPIVLTLGEVVPPETEAFLAGQPTFAVDTTDVEEPVLTCVTGATACETSRVALGLPAAATVTFSPASATTIEPGQEVTITVEGTGFTQVGEPPAEGEVRVDGSCLDSPVTQPLDGEPITVTTSTAPPVPCQIAVSLQLSNGSTQTTTATYPGGTIAGTVRNATTGEPIAAATIGLDDGSTTTSAADGTFAFAELDPGVHTISATADAFQASGDVEVPVAAAQTSTVDVLLSPQLAPGAVRIVLTWDDEPRDVDSHLWLPASQPYHIFYGNRGTLDGCPQAALDIDDVSGFGPETVTIAQAQPGVYRYAVHRFSGAETLSQSNAVVEVYDADGLVRTFTVPLNGTDADEWWHVFDLDVGSGVLTPVNRLHQTSATIEPYVETASC